MQWEYSISLVDLILCNKLNTKTEMFIQDLLDNDVLLEKLDLLLEENGINSLKKMEKFFDAPDAKKFIIENCK